MVGLIPLCAVEVLDQELLDRAARLQQAHALVPGEPRGSAPAHLVCRVGPALPARRTACWRFRRASGSSACCATCSTRSEFLSPYGIRSLSRVHRDHPYVLARRQRRAPRATMCPASRTAAMFGGNSNWRGPVWFPINYLLIEALERYSHFYGDTLLVECPTGSGRRITLAEVARELATRLSRLFLPGRRRPPPLLRRRRALRRRPALARPAALPRVFPRRHRPWTRRQPPDGVDRADHPPVHQGRALSAGRPYPSPSIAPA